MAPSLQTDQLLLSFIVVAIPQSTVAVIVFENVCKKSELTAFTTGRS